MSCRTLPNDISLLDLRAEIGFTYRRLLANPLTLSLAPRFAALLQQWVPVQQKELELDDKVDEALVLAHAADQELNSFNQRTSAAILALTGNDRTHPLYLHYFEGDALHVFTRPLLGEQLKATKKWVTSLTQSEHPSLQALGAELPALLDKATAAEAARESAEHERRQFREVGERKKFIDEVNVARKETYGVLATLPHKHTGLVPRFAESFFRRVRTKGQEEPTIESVLATIEALRQQLEAQEQLLARLEQEAAEAKLAEEAAAKLAKEAQLAEIQKEIERKQKEAAAIQAEIQPL